MLKKISLYLVLISTILSLCIPPINTYASQPSTNWSRYMEYLDRGLVAMKTEEGIYLSWRLLGTEEYDTPFYIYKNGTFLYEVSDTTNYIDTSGTSEDEYYVVSKTDVSEKVKAFSSGENYFDIPLSQPESVTMPDGEVLEYTPWNMSAGDLDGDGQMEIVQRWDAIRRHAGNGGYTGGIILDAYEMDGTIMWRINLGINVRCNTENVFTVYDYNSDGVCELVIKTAPGSMDGTGKYVTEASLVDAIKNADNTVDLRDGAGRVLTGDEYYTLFDGRNGKALDTIYYPIPRGNVADWGDEYGHRCEKYLDTPAYLDGVHPYVVTWRGIYGSRYAWKSGRTAVAALRITEANRFEQEYYFDTLTAGSQYSAQGNHNISVGDVDFDGKDEIVSGALCLDDDLSVLWCSGRGHGDALHLGNYDPTTEGLEYMSVHESAPYGMTVYNAATGEELLHVDGAGDTGRGVMANVGSGGYYQVWGAGVYQSNGGTDFSETPLPNPSYNFRIFWDGDTYEELLDAANGAKDHTPVVTSYNKETGQMEEIFRGWDSETINSTKATVGLTCDILGDWREEILAVREDLKAIRVFVSPIYTPHKIYTLLHDSQYRQSIAWQNEYYCQPPHIGFYLSGDDNEYDERRNKPNITAVKYTPTAFEAPVKIESGVLELPKTQNPDNLIDLDGDYFKNQQRIIYVGQEASLGRTHYSMTGRVYSYLASGNVRYGELLRSWGLEGNDGKFLVLAGHNAGNYHAKLDIWSDGEVSNKGNLNLDFAFARNYSSNGVSDMGNNSANIYLGEDVKLSYNIEDYTFKINDEVVHSFGTTESDEAIAECKASAQKWHNLKADIDVQKGKINITITFGDGEVVQREVNITKNKGFKSIAAETWGYGCVLMDNITLYTPKEEEYIYSQFDFKSSEYQSINKGTIEMDVIPLEKSDNIVALVSKEASVTYYTDLSVLIRFNPDGNIDAYNATDFSAETVIPYNAYDRYHLKIEVDCESRTYSAYVTDEAKNIYILAKDYKFRETSAVSDNLARVILTPGYAIGEYKIKATNITFYGGTLEKYITSAVIEDGVLKVCVNDEMGAFVAQYNKHEYIISCNYEVMTAVDTNIIDILKECAYVKLYSWDKETLEPYNAVKEVC